jgi:hypothetical protein
MIGRAHWNWNTASFGPGSMMGYDRWDNNWDRNDSYRGPSGRMNLPVPDQFDGCAYDAQGPVGRRGMGGWGFDQSAGCGSTNFGMHGMGGFPSSGLASQEPLTIAQAEQAVENYLAAFNNDDLELAEVMVFDNHAYAEIVEKSTGIGAMEVLVDPATLNVYPEYGPNMMWNLKYGMMAGRGGRMGGMMGGYWNQNVDETVSAEMTVTPEQAIANAQAYLDRNLAGATVEDHADPFYGYYTLHVQRDGEVVGMLSVNGFSGDVFLHTWHGDFIEMSEEE